jgi:16S rRNA processing protein RimM
VAERPGHDEWLAVARVLRPRGLKGEVTVDVLTDFPERLGTLCDVHLEAPAGSLERLHIADSWWHQGTLVLRFAGIGSIDEAEKLRGRLLLIPRSQRVRLGPNQYYVWELVGCAVLRSNGDAVGVVTEVEPTGGVDLLRVRADGAAPGVEDLLIPLAEEICTAIDVGARRVVIEPPEGLLDLNRQVTP